MIHEMIRVCCKDGLILIEFVNKNSLALRRKNRAVRLSVKDIQSIVKEYKGNLEIIRISGILFFPQTLMNYVPVKLLNIFERIDSFFSKIFPGFSTRCYFLFKKRKNLVGRRPRVGIIVPDVIYPSIKNKTISGHAQIALSTANILKNNNYDVTIITNKSSNKYILPDFADKDLNVKAFLYDVF